MATPFTAGTAPASPSWWGGRVVESLLSLTRDADDGSFDDVRAYYLGYGMHEPGGYPFALSPSNGRAVRSMARFSFVPPPPWTFSN
jgi:hypothetical protein